LKTSKFASANEPIVELYAELNATIWKQFQNQSSEETGSVLVSSSNNHTTTPTSSQNQTLLFTIYPEISHVWRYALKKEKRGYGDVVQFATYLIEPLLESIVRPHYLNHRTKNESCFLVDTSTTTSATTSTIFNFAIHLRVGDMVIESKREYWENALKALEQLVVSTSTSAPQEIKEIHVYFLYYNGGHVFERNAPKMAEWGIWNGTLEDLPTSHSHLAETCANWNDKKSNNNIPVLKCYWKTGIGVDMEESIDAMVLADGIYMSGSSFSQMLGMWNARAKVRMAAITKELNWRGTDHPAYLTSHAGAFTHPTKYHHVNVDGNLFQEQLAYMNLESLEEAERDEGEEVEADEEAEKENDEDDATGDPTGKDPTAPEEEAGR